MNKAEHRVNAGASSALETYPFHGDKLEVVRGEGVAHVVIRRVCEALGIAFQPQLAKLRDDPAAAITMIVTTGRDGRNYETACIEVRSLPLWLATIHPSKVKPQVRDKLILYRRECADALADHFLGKRGSSRVEARPVTAEGFALAMIDIMRPVLTDALAPIYARLTTIEQHPQGGVVGVAVAGHIKKELLDIAALTHRCGQAKSVRSARTRLDNRLRGVVGWAGTACSWERLPAAKHGEALRELDVLRRTAEGVAEALGRSRQMPLKLVKP